MMQRCGGCQFWQEGRCYRYPPVPVYDSFEDIYGQRAGVRHVWPRTKETDTCGEWRERQAT